jgi:50S ribosomal protein L16 3-hydroxylase
MASPKIEQLLGGLSAQQFLDEYWQKKPLLIRQAFSNLDTLISPEALAGLSCDTDAPARIIAEKGLETAWQSLYSPFDEETFANLPESHWTLLVNDVERYYPELRDHIIEAFRFLPDWRIDDLMISFAVKGGSVGPHTDEYDVFLIQARGQRHWQIAEYATNDNDLIEGIDLRILKQIVPEQEWTLNAGDMLYLPPHVIHNGVALNDCMTFSVGFRAPHQQALLGHYFDRCLEQSENTPRYSDPKRQTQADSGEIDRQSLAELSQLVRAGIDDTPHFMEQCIGQYLTEIKGDSHSLIEDTDNGDYCGGQAYQRSSESRFAYIVYTDKINFFANGAAKIYSVKFIESAKFLCKHYYYDSSQLEAKMEEREFADCFNDLLKNNTIYSSTG